MIPLDGIRAYRLVSAPRPPAEPDAVDPGPAQLFAALTAAHVELSAAERAGEVSHPLLVAAWERPPGQAPLRVAFGGRPSFPPSSSGAAVVADQGTPVPLLYPPGSTAVEIDGDALVEQWRRYPAWTRCLGHPDPLWTPTGDEGLRSVGRGGFDDYVGHLATPFVWLVIAEPVDRATLDLQLRSIETTIPGLRQRESSEEGRVTLERAQARYRELSRARGAGVWRIHILVGATTAVGARSTAAVLCSSSELDELPYALLPRDDTADLDTVLAAVAASGTGAGTRGEDGPQSPFTATSELLAALARPPRRELPGVRLVEPARFDVTPELDGEVHLGDVLDDADQPAGPFTIGTDTLNRHTFVTGATGSGKSQTVRHLLEQLHTAGVPWLVVEPAKAEYAAMAGRIGIDRVVVIRPGDPDAVPLGLNPLEPEPGFPLQTHIDLVRALFLASFDADEPFPQVLGHALERCYRERGWDPVVSAPVRQGQRPPRHPRLGDLQRAALEVVDGIGYGQEIADNVRGFIDVRLGSLRLGTPGRFFEGGYPLDLGDVVGRNVVLEIEDIGADEDKAFFIGVVLIRLYEHLRMHRADPTHPTTGLAPAPSPASASAHAPAPTAPATATAVAPAPTAPATAAPATAPASADASTSVLAPEPASTTAVPAPKAESTDAPAQAPAAAGLRHVTVVEEAHRLLRRVEPGTPAAHAIALFTSLLAEVRAYGEGVVVAEQIPDKIVPDVVKNTALKIVHRLPAADDRELVGATMNLDEAQSRHVVTLPPGRAAVFSDGMDRPIRIAVPLGEARELRPATITPGPAIGGPDQPLTLRELNQASHLAADDHVVLWTELVTAAHLVGRCSPAPQAWWSEQLLARAPRPVVESAVTQAIESAVDARSVGLAEHYSPEDLASHLVVRTLATLDGAPPCDGHEVAWQAGRYRWIDVLSALRHDSVPPDRPHPATDAWAARGLVLSGPTIAAQLDQLRRHPDYWRSSTTVTGAHPGSPSAFEHALDRLAPAPASAEQRLAHATTFLTPPPTRWPLIVFALPHPPYNPPNNPPTAQKAAPDDPR